MEKTKSAATATAHLAEKELTPISGFTFLMANLMMGILGMYLLVYGNQISGPLGFLVLLLTFGMLAGYFSVAPGEARHILLLGHYRGTIKKNGFYWASPLARRVSVSLRTRHFLSELIRAQDQQGYPLHVQVSARWQVADTVLAAFGQGDLETAVKAETLDAIRELLRKYPYMPQDQQPSQTLSQMGVLLDQHLEHNLSGRLKKLGLSLLQAQLISLVPDQALAKLGAVDQQMAVRAKTLSKAITLADQALRKMEQKGMIKLNEATRAKFLNDLVVTLSQDFN